MNCWCVTMLDLWVLFMWWSGVSVVVTAQAKSSCILGTIPNYAVWQEGLLRIEFNSSKNCTSYILFRQSTEIDDMPDITSGDSINFITFTIPSVSILFNTVNMSVRAEDSSGQPVYQRFFIYTQDTANEVENILNTTNCSHTVVCWEPPRPKELPINYYSYQLISNDMLVQSNETTDHCVAFDLTVIKPNMLGFNFTVEAHAPPWNGTKVSIQLIAATAPSVKYTYDVAMVHTDGHPKQIVLLLRGMIGHLSCPAADPTEVDLHLTCGHNPPAVRPIPVHMASSNTTKVIQSDPVEAGHRNCSVVVISSNLSGETINESHVFNTTDVQVFSAYQNSGKICFTFEFAINSSIQQFMVSVSSSTGKNLQSILIWRTSDQRKLTNETKVLPVDLYHLRLFAWDSSHSTYVFTDIAMSVNVTWSNYSSPTSIFTPSPTLMLTSSTPILTSPSVPTADDSKLIVAIAVPVAVTLLVVVALAIGSFVAYQCYIKRCKCHRMSLCDHHRPQNEAVFYRDGHVYFEGGEDLNNPQTSSPPPVQRAHHKPVQQVTYPVQETTTTTDDSETALLSLTPPPVHGHPEPVVSHPVHETTTTTTADSEKALLLTTASPFVSKKPVEESYPVQETAPCTTTSSEERTVPSSLIVPTQPKPEAASFPMQQTAASYTTSKPLKTLESAVIHASSEPAPVDSAPQKLEPYDDSFLSDTRKETKDSSGISETVASEKLNVNKNTVQ